MARVLALLLLFAACVSAVFGSETENAPTADYTAEIPAGGLVADTTKEFRMKPGQVLKIVDVTKEAVFSPVPTQTAGVGRVSPSDDIFDPATEKSLNALAYPYEDGTCNFSKTAPYKTLFKKLEGYQVPLWEKKDPSKKEVSSSVDYIFRNLPASSLEGTVSFCVRFECMKSVSGVPGSQGSLRSGSSLSREHGNLEQKQYLSIIIHSGGEGSAVGLLTTAALALGTFLKASEFF